MKRYIGLFVIAFLTVSVVSTAGVTGAKPAFKMLSTPKLLTPDDGAQISQGDFITWSWTRVPHATEYVIVIQALDPTDPATPKWVDEGTIPVTPTSITDKTVSLALTDSYPGGFAGATWRWKVHASNTEATGPWAGATPTPSDVWNTVTFVN